jgi:hypothetical protein
MEQRIFQWWTAREQEAFQFEGASKQQGPWDCRPMEESSKAGTALGLSDTSHTWPRPIRAILIAGLTTALWALIIAGIKLI